MTNTSSFNGDTYTLAEVAQKLCVTRERARQIEMQALKKLKHPRLRKQWEVITESMDMIGSGK
jgi:DNA-directed RNA polymerase sigma subunit (sigma70/sigma32)